MKLLKRIYFTMMTLWWGFGNTNIYLRKAIWRGELDSMRWRDFL